MQNTNEPGSTPDPSSPLGQHPADTPATPADPGTAPLPGAPAETTPTAAPAQAPTSSTPPAPSGSAGPADSAYPPQYASAGYGAPGQQQAAGWPPSYGYGYGTPGYSAPDPSTGYASAGYPPSGYQAGPAPTAPAYTAPAYTAPAYTAPGSYPPARRLTRSQDDRVISGVLGGLARYWNTDPLLLRILTIVLTIATGGALLLGYLIAWIVIPLDSSNSSAWSGSAGYAAGGNPPYGSTETPGVSPEAPPRPPRSYLGWLVVSIGLILAGILAIIGIFTQTPSFGAIICSVILIVLGVGLIAGAWYGRARWLTVLAVPMVFITMGAVAANAWVQSPSVERWTTSDSGGLTVGSRTWHVAPEDVTGTPLDYRVSVGDAVLDLTDLTAAAAKEGEDAPAPQRVQISAGVGLGQLVVRIPADMQLNLVGSVRAGEIHVPGDGPSTHNGTDVSVTTTIDPLTEGQPAYIVDLDAAIGAGNLEVRRDAA